MGDSGSTVLGFNVAFLALDFIGTHSDGGAARSLLFPSLIAGLPLLDALVVVTRRVLKGQSPCHGDRAHFYDYLLGTGWTARRVAVTCYLLTGCLGVLGWFVVRGGIRRSLILGTGVFSALLVSALYLGALKQARYRVQH